MLNRKKPAPVADNRSARDRLRDSIPALIQASLHVRRLLISAHEIADAISPAPDTPRVLVRFTSTVTNARATYVAGETAALSEAEVAALLRTRNRYSGEIVVEVLGRVEDPVAASETAEDRALADQVEAILAALKAAGFEGGSGQGAA